MSEKNFTTWWNELREDVATYLRVRVQLTRLEAYEKISKVVGIMVSFFILALLVCFVIIFVLIMIGSWIAQLTDSIAIGFSSVAILMLALFIFLFIKRKSVLEIPVSHRVLEALFDEEEIFEAKTGGDEVNNEDMNSNEE